MIALSSNQTKDRVHKLMEQWGNKFTEQPYSAGLLFAYNDDGYPSLTPDPSLIQMRGSTFYFDDEVKSMDCTMKELHAAMYFVQNSTAEWLLRIVDDTYVNIDRLTDYMQHLQSRGPAAKSISIFGHCIFSDGYVYLHGGSGMLMSRHVARLFVSQGENWLKRANGDAEWYFGRFLEKYAQNMEIVCDRHFLGTFQPNQTIIECPPLVWSPSPIEASIFLHDRSHTLSQNGWAQYLANLEKGLMWYQIDDKIVFCKNLKTHPKFSRVTT